MEDKETLQELWNYYQDDCYRGSRYRPTWLGFMIRHIGYKIDLLICQHRGHKLMDFDPGDPENGPNTDVRCTRCGTQF